MTIVIEHKNACQSVRINLKLRTSGKSACMGLDLTTTQSSANLNILFSPHPPNTRDPRPDSAQTVVVPLSRLLSVSTKHSLPAQSKTEKVGKTNLFLIFLNRMTIR